MMQTFYFFVCKTLQFNYSQYASSPVLVDIFSINMRDAIINNGWWWQKYLVKHSFINPFNKGLFKSANGWVGGTGGDGGRWAKSQPSQLLHSPYLPRRCKICHTISTMMKLATVIPYLKNTDSNYIVDVIMWPKFFNSRISMRKVIIFSIL